MNFHLTESSTSLQNLPTENRGRGTKITTRRRSTIARTTISAVHVSDRVGFLTFGLRRRRRRWAALEPSAHVGAPGTLWATMNDRSTLGRGHRPRTRPRIQLRTPRHTRLPQAIAPLRRQRVAFIVASIPVDDLIDLDGGPGHRDHEGVPHIGRRLRGLEMVEQRDLGSLTDPPDDQVAGLLHASRVLPPRGSTGRHVQ